jgi:hypothetical protein
LFSFVFTSQYAGNDKGIFFMQTKPVGSQLFVAPRDYAVLMLLLNGTDAIRQALTGPSAAATKATTAGTAAPAGDVVEVDLLAARRRRAEELLSHVQPAGEGRRVAMVAMTNVTKTAFDQPPKDGAVR